MNEGEFEEFNETQKSRTFEFSAYCWLAVLALVVWVIQFASSAPYLDIADYIGFGVRVVVAAVVPGILGFGGWFLFGRSNTAASAVYFVVFFALAGHAILEIKATAAANEKAAGLAALPEPMSGCEIMAMVGAGTIITADHLWKKPGSPRPDTDDETRFGSLELIGKSHLSRMRVSAKEYFDAVALLDVDKVTNGKRYISERQIELQKVAVQRYLAAIEKFRPIVMGEAAAYEAELELLDFSDEAKTQIMAAYKAGVEKRLPQLLEICDTDRDRGEAAMEMLLTMEKEWGKWKFDRDAEKTRFDSREAQQLHDELLKVIETTTRDKKRLMGNLGGG